MALQSSGAISFSQIAAEFGGSAPHSMSEYYPLAGLGVTGLPSSGTFNFSHFHGKSNQVTVSVWVSSGYNSSSWVNHGNVGYNTARFNTHYYGNNVIGYIGNTMYRNVNSVSSGNTRYDRSSLSSVDNDRGNASYLARKYVYTTVWVDTSSYQNQTTTVSI
jgi:hypothetical protein